MNKIDRSPALKDVSDARTRSTRKIEIADACIGLGLESMIAHVLVRKERARFVLGRGNA